MNTVLVVPVLGRFCFVAAAAPLVMVDATLRGTTGATTPRLRDTGAIPSPGSAPLSKHATPARHGF